MANSSNVWRRMNPQPIQIRELPQVQNTKSVRRDSTRRARAPGLRLSRNGKKYWETRSNRSDQRGTNL